MINFGSCSYLGLELDDRLKQGAHDAIERYGTQFSTSRAYISCGLYKVLEELLTTLFDAPTLVVATTTLGHQSALPTIINDTDLVIMDNQVHASIQSSSSLLKVRGIPVHIAPHNDMDFLEDQIRQYRHQYHRIWYFADGVYSMYGDATPINRLKTLLDTYDCFHIYIDDAHGASWTGKHGRGSVLGDGEIHPKMVVAVSMAKSFGVGGAAIVFPDEELRRKVRTCGGPMIFGGPIQPANLGALIASVKIHLSDEIHTMQAELQERIKYFNELCDKYQLPLISNTTVPIRYIGLGLHRVMYNMVEKLFNDGYFVNFGIFPAVPMKGAGLRCAITRHLSMDDIKSLVERISYYLPIVFKEEERTLQDIERFFKVKLLSKEFVNRLQQLKTGEVLERDEDLTVEYQTMMKNVDQKEWNIIFGDRGSFNVEGLLALEQIFSNQVKKEHNWKFHYLMIKDKLGKVVLATFFTETWWKDDMLAPESVSAQIEEKRHDNPYYLTSKVIMMGSLLTEGPHLYVNREHVFWKQSLMIMLNKVWNLQKTEHINNLVLRDFLDSDKELEDFFIEQGFMKLLLPDSHKIENIVNNEQEYFDNLPKEKRYHVKKHVLKKEHLVNISFFDASLNSSDINEEELYQLYLQVAGQNFEINTFLLPEDIFSRITQHPQWELIIGRESGTNQIISVVVSFKSELAYFPTFIGMDYKFVVSHGIYRKNLWNFITRAISIGKKHLFMGFGAPLEKRRVGAKAIQVCSYVQLDEMYQHDVISNVTVSSDNRIKRSWKEDK